MRLVLPDAVKRRCRRLATIGSLALLAILPASGAGAQTPEELRAFRSRQAAAIASIEALALSRGVPGSAAHTAMLRAGLPALGDIAGGPFNIDNAATRIAPEEPQPLDSDPVFQRRIARHYAAARRALTETPEDKSVVEGRVIGGRAVQDPEFGGTVAIVQTSKPRCTGSYLGGGRVLTAAHCVCDLRLNQPRQGWRIIFGHQVPNGTVDGQPVRPFPIKPRLTSIYPAANGAQTDFCARYRSTGSIAAAGLDLAILVIDGPVPDTLPTARRGSDAVLSQALADDGDLARPFQAVGFGRSWNRGQLVVTGRKHAAFILNGEVCPPSGRLGIDSAACMAWQEASAFDASGRDTCDGDSGGPLFVAGDGPDDWRLIGVTSRGLRRSDPFCGGGGIYALTISNDVSNWLLANGAPPP